MHKAVIPAIVPTASQFTSKPLASSAPDRAGASIDGGVTSEARGGSVLLVAIDRLTGVPGAVVPDAGGDGYHATSSVKVEDRASSSFNPMSCMPQSCETHRRSSRT